MTGFINKLFGKKTYEDFIEDILFNLLEKAGFHLSYEMNFSEKGDMVHVNLYGEDEKRLTEKKGRLLEEMEFFVSKASKNRFPDKNVNIQIDSNEYRESQEKTLVQTVNKIKEQVLEKKKPIFMKPLSSRDRRIVHKCLSEDSRVKTQSLGEGYYKKIKIYLSNNGQEI